jgi:hypothetical protein
MKLTIDKDIPIPPSRKNESARAAVRQVLVQMEIGDSVFIPLDAIPPSAHECPSMFLGDTVKNHKKTLLKGYRFCSRTIWQNGDSLTPETRVKLGIRVWRIPEDEETNASAAVEATNARAS